LRLPDDSMPSLRTISQETVLGLTLAGSRSAGHHFLQGTGAFGDDCENLAWSGPGGGRFSLCGVCAADRNRRLPGHAGQPRGLAALAGRGGNTRDFRCLWRSGLLPLSCSVSVFESGCVVPPRKCGHGFGPRARRGRRAVPRSAAPAGGVVSPS
jgi:hypothetical protein